MSNFEDVEYSTFLGIMFNLFTREEMANAWHDAQVAIRAEESEGV